jgi:predicted CXXCH cytochrome family protein
MIRLPRGSSLSRLVLLVLILASPPSSLLADAQETHGALPCSRCHTSEDGLAVSASSSCRSCHTVQTASSERVLQAFHAPGRACTDCHLFHHPDTVLAGEDRFHFKSGRDLEECSACHVPGKSLATASDGHVAASRYYHSDHGDSEFDSPSDVCLSCHSQSRSPGQAFTRTLATMASAPRFHEEASHPYGIEVPLGSGTIRTGIRNALDERIRLFQGRIECATCHDLTESADDRLVRFASKYDLCLGCHRNGEKEDVFASLAGRSADR